MSIGHNWCICKWVWNQTAYSNSSKSIENGLWIFLSLFWLYGSCECNFSKSVFMHVQWIDE